MSGPERDDDVDAWLQSRRGLLRGADDAPRLEPPPELDQRVIDGARRELRSAQAEKPAFFRTSRFTMPFAIAATVLLSFSLVLEFNRYQSGRDALRSRAEDSAAPAITLTAPVVPSADSAVADARSADTALSASAQGAAQPEPERRSAPRVAEMADANVRQRSASNAYRLPPAAPPPPAPAAEATGSVAPALAPADSAAMNDSRAEIELASRPSVAAKASAAPSPARPRSAAQWWKLVQQLRDAGRQSEADAELKALLTAYPDFVVPATQAAPER